MRKNWHIWVLAAIMFVAFFVRVWNLEDTLYFRMDQARDATIAANAHEQGPGMLTLLGPRAAGSFLRLGPIFYYFQYATAQIADSIEPHVFVFPELLFSILTIPLFYYFLRQFFLRWSSVLVSGLYAFSFLATQYSRFAWNPNQASFWGLLFLLGVYKSATCENKKHAGWWLVLSAVGYGVVSQFHFTALLALPIVAIIFWLFFRPKGIKVWFWVGALGALAFLYVPMILSELSTNWDNFAQFKYALTAKSQEYPLMEKVEQSLRLHGQYYSLVLTSYGNLETGVFIAFFLVLAVFGLWRGVFFWKNGNRKQRAFLMLVGLWSLVFGLLYTKLAFTVLKPRFWLLVAPISYIILALLFEWFCQTGHKKRGRVVVAVICVFLLFFNIYAIGYWFWTIENQKRGSVGGRELVLKQENLVGLKQTKQAAAYMKNEAEKTGKQICFHTEAEFRSPYEYIFRVYYPQTQLKRISFSKDKNENCTFFSIEHGLVVSDVNLPRDHKHEFFVLEREDFGKATVWVIRKKDQDDADKIEQGDNGGGVEEVRSRDLIEQEEDKKEKPKRKKRVFWKDVFEE